MTLFASQRPHRRHLPASEFHRQQPAPDTSRLLAFLLRSDYAEIGTVLTLASWHDLLERNGIRHAAMRRRVIEAMQREGRLIFIGGRGFQARYQVC